jgi:hypothetical protein
MREADGFDHGRLPCCMHFVHVLSAKVRSEARPYQPTALLTLSVYFALLLSCGSLLCWGSEMTTELCFALLCILLLLPRFALILLCFAALLLVCFASLCFALLCFCCRCCCFERVVAALLRFVAWFCFTWRCFAWRCLAWLCFAWRKLRVFTGEPTKLGYTAHPSRYRVRAHLGPSPHTHTHTRN